MENDKTFDARGVMLALPFPLHVANSMDGNGDFSATMAAPLIVGGTFPATVRTALCFNPLAPMHTAAEFDGGDPYGRISFSRILVQFRRQDIPALGDWSDPVLVDNAVSVTNQIVSIYRIAGKIPRVRTLTATDIVNFSIREYAASKMVSDRVYIRTLGAAKFDPQNAANREALMREALAKNQTDNWEMHLWLDMHSAKMSGDFRMTVVLAAVLFESWLKTVLRNHMKKRGATEADIERKFLRNVRGRDEPLTITSVARNLVKSELNYDFENTPEYRRWETELRDVRNRIVHGTQLAVSELEADAAMEALVSANSLIAAKAFPKAEAN